ncbi:hypothetical protein, partial [Flectobacillus sp. BAB-3569]|uniref:hypothetical protein n=1 Tax=Flectobacillus sp. BAB-3569 TaxID=1509483 RepID=UPI000BD5CEEA
DTDSYHKFLACFQEKRQLTESKLDDQFVPFTKDLVIVALVIESLPLTESLVQKLTSTIQ